MTDKDLATDFLRVANCEMAQRQFDGLPGDRQAIAVRVLARKWRQWQRCDECGDLRAEARKPLLDQVREIISDAALGLDIEMASSAEIHAACARRKEQRLKKRLNRLRQEAIRSRDPEKILAFAALVARVETANGR